MSFLLVRVLLTAVIREIRSWRCHILESLIFQHSQCRFPRGTLHNYSASWSTAPAKSLQPCSFPSQWRVVNHGKPLVWFFFSKVEACMQHVRVCKGYSAPPMRSSRHGSLVRDPTGKTRGKCLGKDDGKLPSSQPMMLVAFVRVVWCPLASFHTDAPLGTPFQ